MNENYFTKILQIANSLCWTKLSSNQSLTKAEREFSEFVIALFKSQDVLTDKSESTIQPLIFAIGCLVHNKDLDKAACLLQDLYDKVPIDLKVDLKNVTVEAQEQAVLELCRSNQFKKAGKLFFEFFQSNMVSGDEHWRSKGIIHGTVSRLQRIIMDKNTEVRCKPYTNFLKQLCTTIVPLLPLENQNSNKAVCSRSTQSKPSTVSKACATEKTTKKMITASVQTDLEVPVVKSTNTAAVQVGTGIKQTDKTSRKRQVIESDMDTDDGDFHCDDGLGNMAVDDDDDDDDGDDNRASTSSKPKMKSTRMDNLRALGFLDNTDFEGSSKCHAALHSKLKKTTKEKSASSANVERKKKRLLYNPVVHLEDKVPAPSTSKRKDNNQPSSSSKVSSSIDQFFKAPAPIRQRSPSNESTISLSGRTRKTFTREEIDKIYRGVQKYGVGNWAKIQQNMQLKGRTNVNIKDKWLHMMKSGLVEELKLIHGNV